MSKILSDWKKFLFDGSYVSCYLVTCTFFFLFFFSTTSYSIKNPPKQHFGYKYFEKGSINYTGYRTKITESSKPENYTITLMQFNGQYFEGRSQEFWILFLSHRVIFVPMALNSLSLFISCAYFRCSSSWQSFCIYKKSKGYFTRSTPDKNLLISCVRNQEDC